MASLGDAVLTLSTDSSKLNAGIDAAETKTKSLGGAFSKVGAAAGILGGVTTGVLVGALSDAANAAANDEANVLKLRTAVENSGASWDASSDAINARIKAGQNLAFTDDQVRDSLSLLTAQTGDVNEAMKRQKLAFDFSRGAGIDLQTASKLLGKVTDENINVFARYGIHVEKGGDATAAFAAIQQKFGGQAEAYGNSTAGSIFKIKDSISEWRESMGAALGPATGLIALLPGMSSGMTLAGGAIGGLSSLIKLTFIPSLIALAIPFLPIILVVGAVGLAIGLLALAWSNNWGDIQGKTKVAVDFLLGVFDGFKLLVLNIFRGIVVGVAGAINGVIGTINMFIGAYNAVAEKLGLPLIGKIELITPNLGDVDLAIANVARNRYSQLIVTETFNRSNQERAEYPGLAMGTNFVPQTGLAMLHQGEAVIPAAQNRMGGAGLSVSMTLNYDGAGSAGTAARMASDVVDTVTEQLRQQLRRLGTFA